MPTPNDAPSQRDVTADCGCAPTDAEKASFWGPVSRRTALGAAALGVVALSAFGPAATPAFAVDYPTWEDVERARANESAKAAEISRIQGLIAQLQNDVARTQEAARVAGQAYYDAQQAFILAAERADLLQAQAEEQEAAAADAAQKAAQVAAQLYRNGGDDTALQLFFSDSAQTADEMLARLGTMDKLLEHNKTIYDTAIQAKNQAQSLSDQAAVQRTERDRLQKEAEQRLIEAQEASAAAQAALEAQNANLATLEAQLAALQDNTAKTVAEYEAGVEARRKAEEARKKAEEEARRKAEEEARRKAAEEEERRRREAEEANNNNNGGGGGDTPAPAPAAPAPAGTGWARPSNGWRTSGYGWRYAQCGNGYCASSFHAGVDLAAGCGSGIFAAKSGTVTYSGYNGGYGNYISIDHGGGIGTGYGHIRDGGLLVGYGQWVNAGDMIALEGNTGNSFGCHLHFEVYVNGRTTNPIDFMASQGISV